MPMKTAVLCLLMELDMGLSASVIADNFDVNQSVIEGWLEELMEANYVYKEGGSYFANSSVSVIVSCPDGDEIVAKSGD